MLSDEEILKKVCEEMNIAWNETPGYMTINGQLATDYLETHDIFEDEVYYQEALFNEIELNSTFACNGNFDVSDEWLEAA